MDHSFSATGAIRQHHQQNIRNSLSPSPHNSNTAVAASTTPHHLYRISPTPITNNILSVAAAITAGSYSHYGKISPVTAGASSSGYHHPASPQPTPVLSAANVSSNFYRLPSAEFYSAPPLEQPSQQLRTQQQPSHSFQQVPKQTPACNFHRLSSTSASQQEISYSAQNTRFTSNNNRLGSGQYPLRPNTSSNTASIRVSPTNQGIQGSSFASTGNGNSSYSPQLMENNFRSQTSVQQQQQVKPYQHPVQQQQYSNPPSSSSTSHQSQPEYQSSHCQQQMPQASMSSSHHHQQQQQNNMNKNRYMGHPQQQQNLNNCVVEGVSATQQQLQTAATSNGNSSSAADSVKALIQQVSQQQQQNANNNVNNTMASSPPSVNCPNQPASQQPNSQQQPPQYRIYKRGDSIPGISSPVQLSPDSAASNTHMNKLNGGNADTDVGSSDGNPSSENMQNDKENTGVQMKRDLVGSGKENANESTGRTNLRTPLSQIAEIARFNNVTVEYRLVNETGPPHAPTFTVLLRVGSEEFNAEGPSIKKAQHAAAVEALDKTTLARPPPKTRPVRKMFNGQGVGLSGGAGGNKRPNWNLIQLTTLAQELQQPLQFVQQPVPILDPFRRGDPPSLVSVHVGDKVFTGEGANFNAAKNAAVMIALKAMMKVKQEVDVARMVQAGQDAEEKMMEAENKSPISIVHEMAMKRGLSVQFEILKDEGPPHMKVFTVKCQVGDLETLGEGPTKQAGKKASSEQMIAKLKEIPITVPNVSQGLNLKAMQRGFLRQNNKQQKKKTSIPVVKDLEKQEVSPISRLIQIAHIKKFKEPEFTLISTGTESNVESFLKQITERDRRMLRKKKPVFTIEVTVGPHTCRGTGPNKKAAKKSAAEAAIIALGYEPTEGMTSEIAASAIKGESGTSDQSSPPVSATTGGGKSGGNKANALQSDTSKSEKPVKLAGARQIAPGIIVLKSEHASAGGTTSSAVAQEMKKVSNMMTPCPSASNREGIDKLAYLSKLLEISVSYSDFPKKNEYLSVVSLTTNPPHVAHGCGKTLEEAQNAAALKILEELSTMDLDSVTAAAEKTE